MTLHLKSHCKKMYEWKEHNIYIKLFSILEEKNMFRFQTFNINFFIEQTSFFMRSMPSIYK